MSLASAYQFKYPPEPQFCQKHKLATRIWKGIVDDHHSYELCKCCNRKVGEQQVRTTCCYSSIQLSFLGVGLPLFFSYLRYSILLLIILSLTFCIFGLYTNISSSNCNIDTSCKPNIFNTLSIINKKYQTSYMSIQNYILLVFVIICMITFQFFRFRFRKISRQVDQYYKTPSDYSIILKRLPHHVKKQDIQTMINQRRGYLDEQEKKKTNNLEVHKIILTYDLTQYNKQKNKQLEEFKNMIKQDQGQNFHQSQLPKPSQTGRLAIVVFSQQQSKQLFISQPKFIQRSLYFFFSPCSPLSDYDVAGQRISIQRAPQPDDIIWDHADTTICQQICRKFVLNIISFIILLAGGVAQYGLALGQKNIENDESKIYIGTAASIIVTITNLIIQQYLIYSTMWQRMNTKTQYMDVLTFKLVFLQFLNSGIFVVAATIIANYQTFNLQSNLSETITQIMIFNALTQSVSNFLLYRFDIIGRIMRYLILEKNCMIYTQLQANKLSELPPPSIPYKYSYIIKTLWLTSFYAPFVPIVVPISIIGLILNYLVQKLLFGKSYSAPTMISAAVNNSCIQLLEFIPLNISIGQFLIFLYFQRFQISLIPQYWSIPIYVSIGISLINLFLPMGDINKSIFKIQKQNINQPTYLQIQNQFEVTYQSTDPLLQGKRPRLGDAYVWKKLFGHAPSVEMKQYNQVNLSESTDRSYNSRLNTFYY